MVVMHPQSQPTSPQDQQRAFLQALLAGSIPDERPVFGDIEETVDHIVAITKMSGGNVRAIKNTIETLAARNLNLRALLNDPEEKMPHIEIVEPASIPPLPAGVALPKELSLGGCKLLDEYEAFSRVWSPRGYEQFHSACGCWLFSSVALHRIHIPFGPGEYTPLFFALVAPTTQHAKSTTASIAERTLRAAGLGWVLAPDSITPQKLLSNMSGKLPSGYDKMAFEQRAEAELRYAFSGQVAWFYDEFGQHLDAMTAKNGVMADFKGILRRLDDCKAQASYDTHARGLEKIENPYMSLLASMTPSDARPYAGRDAKFWKDGFFARFSFICPPPIDKNDPRRHARFPAGGDMTIPAALTIPLVQWHRRLGKPEIQINEKKDNKGDVVEYEIIKGELPQTSVKLSGTIIDLFYRYSDALNDLVYEHHLEELAGNYGRLATKALRLAALFASLENNNVMEVRHWARAQELTESWRASLHEMYVQVNNNNFESDSAQAERELLKVIQRLCNKTGGPVRLSMITNFFKRYDSAITHEKLRALAKAGIVAEIPSKQGKPCYMVIAD